MRLTALLVLVGCIHLSAASYSQTVTLVGDDYSLPQVFKVIEKQTAYKVIYNVRFLKDTKTVSVSAKEVPLQRFLSDVLEEQALTFSIRENTILIGPKKEVSAPIITRPVQRMITGKVTDEQGNPLEGITVSVKGTSIATTTDNAGNYQIETLNSAAMLIFSGVGFSTREITTGSAAVVNMRLATEVSDLEEVVVVAYGKQAKVSLTGAISTVQSSDLRKTAVTSFGNALAGRLTGLSATQSGGGMPGSDDPTIYLRGAATMNSSSPLIIIDGVPRDNIRTLDINEVESVSVLKDASATAVYGVRGANGVIIITTKRGEVGKANLSISALQTYSSFTRKPERLHSVDYIDLRNQAYINDGYDPVYAAEIREKYENPLLGLDPNDPDYETKAALRRHIYPDNYFYEQVFKPYAPETHLNANVRGGTERTQYFFNVGYIKQGGHLNTEPKDKLGYDPAIRLDRWSFRSNLDYQMSDFLTARLNIASYIEDQNTPTSFPFSSTEEMLRGIMLTTMLMTPVSIGPTTMAGVNPDVPGDHIIIPIYADWAPYGMINRNGYEVYTRTNLNSSLEFEFDFGKMVTPGLSGKVLAAYDVFPQTRLFGQRSERTYYAEPEYERNSVGYSEKASAENPMTLTRHSFSNYNINFQASLNYNRSFNKHQVSGLFLAQRDYWEAVLADLPYNVVGVAARGTYNYDERYFAEINMGYNGSEQFSPKKRFGFFPAYSAAWVLSNEQFYTADAILQLFKIRGSYGRVGNDKIGGSRFLYLDNITIGQNNNVGGLGIGEVINQGLLGNLGLTWEVADKLNIGMDFKLLNVLSGSVDVFSERRSQILIQRSAVPVYQGIPAGNIPKANLGKVNNRGVELELVYNGKLSNDFFITAKGNLGFNKNVVVYNDEPRRDETYAYAYTSTGYGLGQQWGYKVDWSSPGKGYWTSGEEIEASGLTYSFGSPQPGDLKYVDLNGDEIIDQRDMAPIGYTSIPGVTFGFDVNFEYKGFDFSVFLSGVGRYSSIWSGDGIYENVKQGTYFGYHHNAWTRERFEQGAEITYPRLSTGTTSNHVANEFFLQDRSFIRLRNLQVGYTLSDKVLERLGVGNLRIFASGQNLFLWDKLKMSHQDPEKTHPVQYPITKFVGFGMNVSF
ncbi:MAG TPA: TonB-dependent receptor [Parapedobacter sp.]|uniref:TonB-dependent receptor n=1 Tax=Parapedobacter sp. TaxID=1958893 RepID=UPI002BD89F05|nr:TonB-dependent receptor [Parapedobacter sp.]HWK56803.1 TonB-dependent receptor [Parapedobacter sp.]